MRLGYVSDTDLIIPVICSLMAASTATVQDYCMCNNENRLCNNELHVYPVRTEYCLVHFPGLPRTARTARTASSPTRGLLSK